MIESRRVPEKGRIRARTEKLFGRVPKNGRISVSTGKWYNPGEYRKKVESVQGPKKLFGRVPKNCTISMSTGKW